MTPAARRTFLASFLGWTLDSFDFMLLTFVITRIGATFERSVAEVTVAITLTLACRPVGALLFGWLGDRYGRRTPLMIDIGLYSVIQLLTAFSPNFTVFLALRAVFGVAMGGEWGLGAALTMEALPPGRRGFFSGLLQQGYMVGYLLAALVYFLVFHYTHWDWRALFIIGALPALLILYVRAGVPESPSWLAQRSRPIALSPTSPAMGFAKHWPLFLSAIVFMAAFNAMSHGTQDLYATFLQKQHGFAEGTISSLSIVAAFGAIAGGTIAGIVSERIGRRPAIMICTALAFVAIPLWAFSVGAAMLAAGAFAMQFCVQGAWGVIPAHLNELSPSGARGTFPGFTYQLGNLLASGTVQLEAAYAHRIAPIASGAPNYGGAMATVIAIVLGAVFVLAAFGYFVRGERRGVSFAEGPRGAAP